MGMIGRTGAEHTRITAKPIYTNRYSFGQEALIKVELIQCHAHGAANPKRHGGGHSSNN
jgi:hypothetical protein